MEVSRHSSRPRTAGSWGGIVVIVMRFCCQWVSRIPWTFIMWWYFRHAILFYLSLSNAVNNVLQPEPFSVVLTSSHSAIPCYYCKEFCELVRYLFYDSTLSIHILLAL